MLTKASKNRIGVVITSVIFASFLLVKFVKELGLAIDIKSDELLKDFDQSYPKAIR